MIFADCMESKRQQKFSRLLQKELAEIFQRDVTHLFHGAYISISQVRVSPDLGVAKIYVSLLLGGDNKAILQEIKVNTKAIRHALAQRIKNQVRITPDLIFYLDDSAEYAARMDKVISELNIPPASEEEEQEEDEEEK
jgi:ribosome-binding factor A